MIEVTFPDKSVKKFDKGISGLDIAHSISPSLAKRSLAMIYNGKLDDIFRPINQDGQIEFIDKKHKEALELLRHDCAHLLAQAIKRLYPSTQITIGPVIKDGFFYDIAPKKPLSTDDLEKIELEMKKIVDENLVTKCEVWEKEKAVSFFKSIDEYYKAEIINDLSDDEDIKIYFHGDWLDLCRGPHLPSTSLIGKNFKLTHLAGAYWRGNSDNEMLQRIYGTCFFTKEELDAHLFKLEESKKRDHRIIGKKLNYFHFQEDALGSVFWHPLGYQIWQIIEQYLRKKLKNSGYQEIKTPQLLDNKLWKKSGHWDKFRENMFVVPDEIPSTDDEQPIISADAKLMALKPMNCPAHIQIFNQGIRSYRDLPLRFSEFGCCHRNEAHGALHGLMRVRQMTQDDGHIFCAEDQVMNESIEFCRLLNEIYNDFGFKNIVVKLATRPEKRTGSDEVWDKAEKAMEDAMKKSNMEYEIAPGEGAFYGPKLEFHLEDAIGRSWQCGTLQCDFNLPAKLDASFINSNGEKEIPVMLHRAILGTLERFIGILIESYNANLPYWLCPIQVAILPIISKIDPYTYEIEKLLKEKNIRCYADVRNEKVNYKIRDNIDKKIPILFIVGENEMNEKTVTIRYFGKKEQENLSLDDAINYISKICMVP